MGASLGWNETALAVGEKVSASNKKMYCKLQESILEMFHIVIIKTKEMIHMIVRLYSNLIW